MPCIAKGGRKGLAWKFSALQIVKWFVAMRLGQPGGDGANGTLLNSKKRRALAEAESAELSLAIQRGDTIRLDDALVIILKKCNEIKAHCMALPSKVSPVAVGKNVAQCRTILRAALNDCLRSLKFDDEQPETNARASHLNALE